jgi:hypothetical protein
MGNPLGGNVDRPSLRDSLRLYSVVTIFYSDPTRFVKCGILFPSDDVAHVFWNQ